VASHEGSGCGKLRGEWVWQVTRGVGVASYEGSGCGKLAQGRTVDTIICIHLHFCSFRAIPQLKRGGGRKGKSRRKKRHQTHRP